MIVQSDSLEFLKTIKDFDNDIIYCDPPYALGSEVIIRKDGKVDYKKANDFMSKWEMPTGEYWEKWFTEAYRTLKHGGWLIMFGMDRQLLLFKYYALLAGFEEQQSLYWYFISNFPKATDLSKMLDKNAGVEREVVKISTDRRDDGTNYELGMTGNITSNNAITDLAKKYDGYKYSISPLKQTNETIMVFKKPSKTGSVLHDTLAYENGDKTITVGALNIDGNRVGTEQRFNGGKNGDPVNTYGKYNDDYEGSEAIGRYPAQTFVDEQTAEVLDRQSGVSKGNNSFGGGSGGIWTTGNSMQVSQGYDDIGGASKILHKCKFEKEDMDLYHYEPKVSGYERNAGLGNELLKDTSTGLDTKGRTLEREDGSKTLVDRFVKQPQQNNHPTLKPIALNEQILKLFKTPNQQKICYAFGGAGSEIIGGIKAGFDNLVGCEINQEYVDIANARIKYWKETMTTQTDIFEFIG